MRNNYLLVQERTDIVSIYVLTSHKTDISICVLTSHKTDISICVLTSHKTDNKVEKLQTKKEIGNGYITSFPPCYITTCMENIIVFNSFLYNISEKGNRCKYLSKQAIQHGEKRVIIKKKSNLDAL